MLRSLTILLVFQSLGEVLSFGLHAPIPGPVFGMLFLFGFLMLREGEAARLQTTAQELLKHLSLLFVPAGVGVMMYFETVEREWLPIVVSVVLSTALTIVVTALTVQTVHRWISGPEKADAQEPE